jgi:hypothetical protein
VSLWFSPGTPASSTTKTGHHDIAEILQKVELNTINQIIKSNVLLYLQDLSGGEIVNPLTDVEVLYLTYEINSS